MHVCYFGLMNQLSNATRAKVVSCLVAGNSIPATVRMTGVAKNTVNTVVKLLADLGKARSEYQDKALVNLPCSASSVIKPGRSWAASKRM